MADGGRKGELFRMRIRPLISVESRDFRKIAKVCGYLADNKTGGNAQTRSFGRAGVALSNSSWSRNIKCSDDKVLAHYAAYCRERLTAVKGKE